MRRGTLDRGLGCAPVGVVGSARGFSLFEAMLALVLVVGMSGAVLSFLFNVGRQREGLDREAGGLRGGAALLEALEADVAGVIAGDARAGRGVVGTETSVTLLTRGVGAVDLRGGLASLGQDLQRVSYTFDPAAGTLTARRSVVQSAGGTGGGIQGGAGGESVARVGEATSVIAEGVGRLRLRYFDGRVWSGTFDSGRSGGLPVAIEVALWFGRAPGADVDAGAVGGGVEELGADGLPLSLEEAEAMGRRGSGGEDGVTVWPGPSRVRMIVIPDGPVAGWSQAR